MKILFVITGFGYGDTMRMKAIINELRQKVKDFRIMILGYEHSYNYFHKKYLTLKMGGYSFPDKGLEFKPTPFIARNLLLPAKWASTWLEHKNVITRFDPDFIISDFEPLGIIIGKKISKPIISVFAYDPELYKNYPKKTMSLNLQAKYLETLYKSSTEVFIPSFTKYGNHGHYHYIPPIVKRDEKALADDKALMKKLGLKKKPILVMLGGSNYGIKLAEKIRKNIPKHNEDFIFFGAKKQLPTHHYLFKYNFLEYLKVSKALITLGGNLTLAEALTFKKPTLAFPIKDHVEQLLNVYALKDTIMEGDPETPEKSVATFLRKLDHYTEQMKKTNINTNGASILAQYLLKQYP